MDISCFVMSVLFFSVLDKKNGRWSCNFLCLLCLSYLNGNCVTTPCLFVLLCYLHKIHHFVQVYLYGGHVTSWKNEHGEELLFVSSKVLHISTGLSVGSFASNSFFLLNRSPG